jgi:CRISPR system Cascade subunit CasB
VTEFYWEQKRFSAERPPGDDLAALRRGVNQPPGGVPAMWRFYRTWRDGDDGWQHLQAEHHALVLFAFHQQSQHRLVHEPHGPSIGAAARTLHSRFQEAAVDRRFFAASTAATLDEVAYHLRRLLQQTRALAGPARIDYTGLYWDLAGWEDPERRGRTQRRWGRAYCGATVHDDPATSPAATEGER